MTTDEQKPRQMPKGGRKGGSVFPRIALNDAIGYGKRLVSKTHIGAQPKDVILSGVVGAKGGVGNVRISALKQYGLLEGDSKVKYSATELAKRINSSPEEEVLKFYREASLNPNVFKKIFDTFHGDSVSKSKLRQRAADLKVHPDETENCVEIYVSTMVTAGLVSLENDKVNHSSVSEISNPSEEISGAESTAVVDSGIKNNIAPAGESDQADATGEHAEGRASNIDHSTSPAEIWNNQKRGVFNVNINLDSSLDIDKLQKQLELLKKFGAI